MRRLAGGLQKSPSDVPLADTLSRMDADTQKTTGKVVGGCGGFLLVLMAGWMCFLLYIGIQGRGNDEETSMILGLVSCGCSIPIVLLTGAGLFFGFRKNADGD